MAYQSGLVSVGTSATAICTVGEDGGLLQNLGSVAVTLGGPGVTTGNGPTLPASQTSPTFVPGARSGASGLVPAGPDATTVIYGVVASTTANVAFAAPVGG